MNYQILLFAYLLTLYRRKHPLTCSDIALLGHFDICHCCPECHALAVEEGAEVALVHDGFHGKEALLCCHSSLMLHGFEGVPNHSEEYA